MRRPMPSGGTACAWAGAGAAPVADGRAAAADRPSNPAMESRRVMIGMGCFSSGVRLSLEHSSPPLQAVEWRLRICACEDLPVTRYFLATLAGLAACLALPALAETAA